MEQGELKSLREEIEKLKFHNRTLLTLLGQLLEEDMHDPSIHEAIVVHDLSKAELQEFTQLIRDYEGDMKAFKQQSANLVPKFTDLTVKGLLQAFIGSNMMTDKCESILQSYEIN